MEPPSNYLCDMLHKIPLLLGRLLQACAHSLSVSVHQPYQLILHPFLDLQLLLQPHGLGHALLNKAAQVVDSSHHLQTRGLVKLVCPLDVFL